MLNRNAALLAASGKNATWGEAIKHGAVFYWNGTKQFGRNFVHAQRLVRYRMAGYTLSWSDKKHLEIMSGDMKRMVPFSFFIIVPFMEFLLPFALYFFPSLLPSTYETEKQRAQRTTALRATQVSAADALGQMCPNLKSEVQSVGKPKFDFHEPAMDLLTQEHAYALTRSFQKRAPLGKYWGLAALKVTIRRYVRKIHEEDCALLAYGIVNVPKVQVDEACLARCIVLSRDALADWVQKSAADATATATAKLLFEAAASVSKA